MEFFIGGPYRLLDYILLENLFKSAPLKKFKHFKNLQPKQFLMKNF